MESFLDFSTAVADLCGIPISEIKGAFDEDHPKEALDKEVADVVRTIVLPKGLKRGRYGDRLEYISPQFMRFMAGWGKWIYENSPAVGIILFQLALGRIEKGAVVSRRVPMELSFEYQPYNPSNDIPMAMDMGCLEFIKEMLSYCLLLAYPVNRKASGIFSGLLANLAADGTDAQCCWWNEETVGMTKEEALALVNRIGEEVYPKDKHIQVIMAKYWRQNKPFFKKLLNERRFIWDIHGLSPEYGGYFNGWPEKVLKAVKLYDWLCYWKMTRELQ